MNRLCNFNMRAQEKRKFVIYRLRYIAFLTDIQWVIIILKIFNILFTQKSDHADSFEENYIFLGLFFISVKQFVFKKTIIICV